MKILYTLTFLFSLIYISQAQIIQDFDQEFKLSLISKGVDLNGDGEIQISEAELVDSLTVLTPTTYKLKDPSQLRYFKNITYLALASAEFDTLDISGFKELTYYWSDWYTAEHLIAHDLENLRSLSTTWGLFTISLDGTENIEFLSAGDNFGVIPEIDYDKLSKLKQLYLIGVSPTEVLDFDGLVNLEELTISEFGGYLKRIRLKNGRHTEIPYLSTLSTLEHLCTDEEEVDYVKSRINVNHSGRPETEVNTYCTFESGGIVKKISGTSYIDFDGDGCDENDPAMPRLKYEIIDNSSGYSKSRYAHDGSYAFEEREGTYRIIPHVHNPQYYKVTPEYSDVNITDLESDAYLDFCIEKIGEKRDAGVSIYSIGRPRPGFTTTYKLNFNNGGNTKISGEVKLNFDNKHMTFVSSEVEAESLEHGEMIWRVDNLLPNEYRNIDLKFEMNKPTDSEFPLMGGEKLKLEVSINTEEADEDLDNNTKTLNQLVVNSHDPNDITMLEGDSISFMETGEYVHYLVRFENKGTAEAVNIVVKDTINGGKFDLESFVPMEGSHPYKARINDEGIVEFIFENINLPYEGEERHGQVLFKIKTKESLIEGDQFMNSAAIYFDYNFPIFTNEFETQVVGIALPVKLASFNADQREDDVHLNWVVQSEENLSHYIVERRHESEDDFRSVDRVTASNIAAYTATDKDLMSQGIYYYRLKMVDNDGASQLSDIVTINYSKRTEMLSVYPNPASDFLVIENGYANSILVTILNAAGQEVSNFEVSERTKKEVNISGLSKGLHFISFYRDGAIEVKKIFIDK